MQGGTGIVEFVDFLVGSSFPGKLLISQPEITVELIIPCHRNIKIFTFLPLIEPPPPTPFSGTALLEQQLYEK